MKRVFLMTMAVSLVGLSPLFGISKAKLVQWNGIITEKDQASKLLKLEEFEKEYGTDKDNLTTRLYVNLTDTAFKLQKYEKTIQYGEITLAIKELDTGDKLQVLLDVANAFYVTKIDVEKAFNYAGQVIDLAGSATDLPMQPEIKGALYVAPALRVQVKILYGKDKDPAAQVMALNKSVEAYSFDKSDTSLKLVLALGNRLNAAGNGEEVLKNYEKAYTFKADSELARQLGLLYSKAGNEDKAIEYMKVSFESKESSEASYSLGIMFSKKANAELDEIKKAELNAKAVEYLKASFKIKKSAEVGYYVGVLLNKVDIDTALAYLAESFLMEDARISPKSEQLLLQLYVNKTKEMKQEERDAGYEEILAAARGRLGK